MEREGRGLDLVTRKALIARMLRARAEIGAIGEEELRALQGRIEAAVTRADLDAAQHAIEEHLEN